MKLESVVFEVLRKETFWFVDKVDELRLPDTIQRVEFGALFSHEGTFLSKRFQESVLGRRVEYVKFNKECFRQKLTELCVLCQMHFFGLHRVKDQLEQICSNGTQLKLPVKNCFWSRPQKQLPQEVLKTKVSIVNAKRIGASSQLCPPDDLAELETRSEDIGDSEADKKPHGDVKESESVGESLTYGLIYSVIFIEASNYILYLC